MSEALLCHIKACHTSLILSTDASSITLPTYTRSYSHNHKYLHSTPIFPSTPPICITLPYSWPLQEFTRLPNFVTLKAPAHRRLASGRIASSKLISIYL